MPDERNDRKTGDQDRERDRGREGRKEGVRRRYGAVARAFSREASARTSECCCSAVGGATDSGAPGAAAQGAGCCSGGPGGSGAGLLYEPGQLDGLPAEATRLSLGCGNPTALVTIIPGEVVLDLGSGSGLDALLAARRVGPAGKVYGLDMTGEMVSLARENQRKAGLNNVEFLHGDIEAIPLPADSVDVIVSNCVVNLATDKDRVFREVFRVLRPGGRLAIADTVFQGDVSLIPRELREDMDAWAGCVAGALEQEDYLSRLAAAGFVGLSLTITDVYGSKSPSSTGVPSSSCSCCGGTELPEGVRLASGFIRGYKPGTGEFGLRRATAADLPAVKRLLAEADLPEADIEDQFEEGFVVATGAGRVIGAAGLEVWERHGLLRSVVVETGWRGRGVGQALVRDRVARARSLGLESLWLLTATAAPYFTRLGFIVADRAAAPEVLRSTAEFAGACPACATAMRLRS